MSDTKPCRWLKPMRFRVACAHQLFAWLGAKLPDAKCHGCPCHEPEQEESGVKDSLTAQPDHIRDTNKMVCKWWQDEHGNWCCSCRATLPQFTPWRSLSPAGHNCPYCRAIIGVEPRYDEQIHTCGPFCERPECVRAQRDEMRGKLYPETGNHFPDATKMVPDPEAPRRHLP